MKVTVHTELGLLVEVYDTDLTAAATDRQILNAIRDQTPAESHVVAAGSPFVYARGLDALGEAGRRIESTRAAAGEALAEARRLAADAVASGASEHSVAKALGVNRMTVREWLGKRER